MVVVLDFDEHVAGAAVLACVRESFLTDPVEGGFDLGAVPAGASVRELDPDSTSRPSRRARSARSSMAACTPASSSAMGRSAVMSERTLKISDSNWLGASTRRRVDFERPAEEFRALRHDVESEPVRLLMRVESLAVVADG